MKTALLIKCIIIINKLNTIEISGNKNKNICLDWKSTGVFSVSKRCNFFFLSFLNCKLFASGFCLCLQRSRGLFNVFEYYSQLTPSLKLLSRVSEKWLLDATEFQRRLNSPEFSKKQQFWFHCAAFWHKRPCSQASSAWRSCQCSILLPFVAHSDIPASLWMSDFLPHFGAVLLFIDQPALPVLPACSEPPEFLRSDVGPSTDSSKNPPLSC